MRGAALIFGLLAGVLGGAVLAMGALDAGLAAHGVLGPEGNFLPRFLLLLIPNLGLLGAGLALSRPRLGGVLMLLSAIAWAAVGILVGRGTILFVALPFTFVAAGGLVALFSPRAAEREPEPAPTRRPPPEEPRWEAPEPGWTGGRRPNSARREPPPPRRPAPIHPFAATRPEPPPPAEDFIDAVEDFDEPAPGQADDGYPADDGYYDDDETGVAPSGRNEPDDDGYEDEEEPADSEAYDEAEPYEEAEPYADPEPEPAAAPPRRRGSWSLPEPQPRPAPAPAARYAESREPPPSRHQPAPPPPVRPARRSPEPELPPEDRFFAPPAPRYAAPEQRYAATEDEEDDTPRRRFDSSRRGRAVANDDYDDDDGYDEDDGRRSRLLPAFTRFLVLAGFVLVVAGLAVAVYLDYQRGPQSLLFGGRPAPTVSGEVQLLDDNPPLDDAAFAQAIPSLAETSGDIPTLETAAPAAPTYDDPFAYCANIATADSPGPEYTGPAVPRAVAAAFKLAASAPLDNIRWRCAGRVVLVCAATPDKPAACYPTPNVDIMLGYCAANPDTGPIPAPNGWWSCDGTKPVIPPDQSWPVDSRGFYPGAWTVIGQSVGG